MLKNHAYFRSERGQVCLRVGKIHAVNNNFSVIYGLKFVDSPQESAFAGAARAAYDDDFAFGDFQVDVFKDVMIVKPFVGGNEFDQSLNLLLKLLNEYAINV
jgi:hypothetical protein